MSPSIPGSGSALLLFHYDREIIYFDIDIIPYYYS